MREKFISYMNEVGIRYALTYAKYEGISLAMVQLWILGAEPSTSVQQMDDVACMYNRIHIPA
jgi:hypothetical protein